MSDHRGQTGLIGPTRTAATPGPGSDLGLGDDVEIIAELGRGARTVVFHIRRGDVDYALKMFKRSLHADQHDGEAFCREAALLARVNHPGVPAVFDVGTARGRPYLVQEYVDGPLLLRVLDSGPLDEPVLHRLATDVAAALDAAHRAGVIHRDIKPANILIAADGRARLIDFGLAAVGEQSTGGSATGTFQYTAPEQTGMLSRAVDGRADLYSLGVVLFQCATGHLPFDAEDVGDLLAMHASAPVPDPRTLRPDLSDGWVEIVTRLMAKDPDDRFQTASGLLRAVSALTDSSIGPPVHSPESAERSLGSHPPMAGREHEHAQLVERWQQARSGRGGAALVVGAPGTGKSHLARAVLDVARGDGGLVLAGKCDQDSSVPLAPLRAAIEGHLRAVESLPADERAQAVQRLRDAAGAGAALLRPLSPTLAVLLDAPHLPAGEQRHEQFVNAVVGLLTELAATTGGLLILDDVQWLDTASRAVLRRLVEGIDRVPLLVLATGRDDAPSIGALRTFETDMGEHLDPCIDLAPLDEEETRQLVSWYLAGATVGDDVIAEVTARGQGNALTILEFLRAVINAGALRPSWGTWRLVADVLQAIDLPHGVMDLILARIDGLGPVTRAVLTNAAASGVAIDAALLAEVCGTDVTAALADAVSHGLLRSDGEGCVFIHDRIREALLSAVGPEELRRLHQWIAECLAAARRDDPPGVYSMARHFAQGETHRTPEKVFASGWAAGELALAESAPDAAVSFLEVAAAAAAEADIEPDSRFREALGVAYWLTGRIEPARAQLETGLAEETDPLRRAALRLQLAGVLRTSWELSAATRCARLGLAELGRPVPDNPVLFGLMTARAMIRWLVRGSRPPAARPAQGEEAERLRLFVLLCRAASSTAAINLQHGQLVAFNVLPSPIAHRLGPTTAYVHHLAGVGSIAGSMGMRKRRDRIYAQAYRIAEEIGDPKAHANTVWFEGFAKLMGKDLSMAEWNDASDAQRDWLELDFYTNVVLMRGRDLLARGYATEALSWHDRGRSRISEATVDVFPGFAVLRSMIDALHGRNNHEAPATFAARAAEPLDTGHAIQFVLGAVHTALEHGELGEPLETALQAFDRLGVSASALFPEYRMIYAYETLARLAQCQRAEGTDRAARLDAANTALRRLKRAANSSGPSAEPRAMNLLRGYHRTAEASLWQLRGEHERAIDVLARAAKDMGRLDAPLVEFEVARVRARALAALGEDALSTRAAHTALTLAQRHGWMRRERGVRSEFGGLADTVTRSTSVSISRHSTDSAGIDRSRHRLVALQQVSRAAARILDPHEMARVALDETLRILGAERAMLFLVDEGGALQPSLGRDAASQDLVEFSAYSSTLVDRAAAERTCLVVTGSEEGALLGSESAVVHGLRSIMVAPLELDDRLIGVVYLDSRVAKGVFTEADIEILTAVTSHIAVSIETARAAQLEIAVQSAREQRDTAELLRHSMQELTATLNPGEVLARLTDIMARVIPADRVCVIHQDDELILSSSDGTELRGADVEALLTLGQACHGDGAATMPSGIAGVLRGVRGWLAAPLITRDHGRGVLLAGSRTSAFSRTHLDIASALASEGAVAYANARLFAEVQRRAVTDALTGVHNRRHFAELANQHLSATVRNNRSLVVMMVDVDHFKKVNDTYGHGCGDDVIRMVARTLQSQIRDNDLLGRYGGEEFVVMITEPHAGPGEVAERLRSAVAATSVDGPLGPVHVTVSIGVTELRPDDDLGQLVTRADEALYHAKQNGRDQVRLG